MSIPRVDIREDGGFQNSSATPRGFSDVYESHLDVTESEYQLKKETRKRQLCVGLLKWIDKNDDEELMKDLRSFSTYKLTILELYTLYSYLANEMGTKSLRQKIEQLADYHLAKDYLSLFDTLVIKAKEWQNDSSKDWIRERFGL